MQETESKDPIFDESEIKEIFKLLENLKIQNSLLNKNKDVNALTLGLVFPGAIVSLFGFFAAGFDAGLGLATLGLIFSFWRYNLHKNISSEYNYCVEQLSSKFGLRWEYEEDSLVNGRFYHFASKSWIELQ